MTSITVLSDEPTTTEGSWQNGQPVVSAAALNEAIGWTLKPEGLCRDDVCIPVADRSALEVNEGINLAVAADLVGRNTVSDPDAGVVVIGMPNASRSAALRDRQAPDFTLPDLAGKPQRLSGWRGNKKLLVAFSSW